MRKTFRSTIFSLSIISSYAVYAGGGYIGGGLGVSDVDQSSKLTPNFAISLNGGGEITPGFSLGLDIQNYSKKVTDSGISVELSIVPVLLAPRYHFEQSVNHGFWAGPAIGFGETKVTFGGLSASKTTFMLGAQVGYEFQVSEHFGMGPKASYVHSFKATGDTVSVDAFNFYSLLVDLHYLF